MLALSAEEGLELFDAARAGRGAAAAACGWITRRCARRRAPACCRRCCAGWSRAPARAGSEAERSLARRLAGVPEAERARVVLELVRTQIAAVLGLLAGGRPRLAFKDARVRLAGRGGAAQPAEPRHRPAAAGDTRLRLPDARPSRRPHPGQSAGDGGDAGAGGAAGSRRVRRRSGVALASIAARASAGRQGCSGVLLLLAGLERCGSDRRRRRPTRRRRSTRWT